MAIISLVAGIAGYVLPHPFIAGVIAIYAGHRARKEIRQTGEAGANLALIGLILGYLHLALSVALVILVILLVVGLGALIATSTPR
jgi:F0F1-type ATP synthase assembly protein I